MLILSSMEVPTIDVDLGAEKINECHLCDTEVVHKLAQMFLPGLASACVDNTSGSFRSPGSVAVDFRKEMILYLTHRTESFVAESIILDGEVLDHPFDIISNFVDDFANSKRNFFTRVSGWALSDKREDQIDDFIQEIEMNGFWTLDRREAIAQTLLKNVDFDNTFHCTATFNSSQDLANHLYTCNFRPMICQNQGCNAKFCAGHLRKHDSTCPFKIIPCEQRCPDNIMRRDMDRHCITVCPMKLVNCPFYAVGCRSAVAQCMIEKHCLDDVQSHLWHLLKGIYKEASGEDLKQRVEQILQASISSSRHLSKARDIRSLNFIIKDIEAKLGPMEVGVLQRNSGETIAKNDDRDTNTNGSESTTQSSDKAEVSGILTMHTIENAYAGKSEESEQSHTENKCSEERTQTSNITKLPDKADIDFVDAQIYKDDKDGAAGELKLKGNEEDTQTNAEEISATNEEDSTHNSIKNRHIEDKDSIQNPEEETTTNITKLPDKAEIDAHIYEDKDDAAGELKFKGNEESTQTNPEEVSATNEDSAQSSIKNRHIEDKHNIQNPEEETTTNITKLPDKAEIDAHVYEDKDDAAGELKFKGNEENTRTNPEEVGATNEDSAQSSIKNRHIEDKHNIQNPEKETMSSTENNAKNKDTEDDNIDESTQTSKV